MSKRPERYLTKTMTRVSAERYVTDLRARGYDKPLKIVVHQGSYFVVENE